MGACLYTHIHHTTHPPPPTPIMKQLVSSVPTVQCTTDHRAVWPSVWPAELCCICPCLCATPWKDRVTTVNGHCPWKCQLPTLDYCDTNSHTAGQGEHCHTNTNSHHSPSPSCMKQPSYPLSYPVYTRPESCLITRVTSRTVLGLSLSLCDTMEEQGHTHTHTQSPS